MIVLPILGFVVGFVTVYKLNIRLPSEYASYIGVATLAGLDSVFGGIRAGVESKFHDDIFFTGFVVNMILAGAIAYLGDLIGVELVLAAAVVLGGRVFLNLSLIRRYLLTQTAMVRKRE